MHTRPEITWLSPEGSPAGSEAAAANVADGVDADVTDGADADVADGADADVAEGANADVAEGADADVADGADASKGAARPAPPVAERCAARLRFPAACAWFDGHFPNRPVLPGVALLAAVRAVVSRFRWAPAPAARRVTGFGRVRFRQPVGPDQPLRLTLQPSRRGNALRFVITSEAEAKDGAESKDGAEVAARAEAKPSPGADPTPICEGLAQWAEAPAEAPAEPDRAGAAEDPACSGEAWRWR